MAERNMEQRVAALICTGVTVESLATNTSYWGRQTTEKLRILMCCLDELQLARNEYVKAELEFTSHRIAIRRVSEAVNQ